MSEINIYTDCSFDAEKKLAVGACKILYKPLNSNFSAISNADSTISEQALPLKEFPLKCDSCGKGELLTMIWALQNFKTWMQDFKISTDSIPRPRLNLYTDSKTIADLPARRIKLEQNEFRSKRTGKLLSQEDHYKEIYNLIDQLRCEFDLNFTWVKGHTSQHLRSTHEQMMSEVDQFSRDSLRKIRAESL
ncbi:MAG: hypothetical protein NT027_16300 [Proteobacteria bacterium]|nr:hypothetical protein [Pseudomonadota bacterium]